MATLSLSVGINDVGVFNLLKQAQFIFYQILYPKLNTLTAPL